MYLQERPGTQRFNPKMEAPVSLELTIEAASLATDARQFLAVSNSSPQDASTMLTLANKPLDESGIQFVYNEEGYEDLQSSDGHIDVLARPKK